MLELLNCHFHGVPGGKTQASAILPAAVRTGLKKWRKNMET